MRRYILFIIICFAFSTSQAQMDLPGKIEWGEELRGPNNTRILKIISFGSSGFYAVRLKTTNAITGEQLYLESYDGNQKLKKAEKIDLKYKGKQREFEDVVKVGGQLYLLTSYNNQSKKKNYLFYQKVSRRLTVSKTLVKIGEIDTRNKVREGSFDIVISKDSSRVLLYNQLPYHKNEPERFAFYVFDNNFEELWYKDIVLPYPDDQFSVEEYQIDKEGNIYLLGVIFEDKVRTRRKGRPTYKYTVLAYRNRGEDFKEYKLNLTDKFITDLTFRIGNDGNLVCSGFYSEKGTYSIKGTYFFKLNAETEEIYNSNFKAFDFEFLTEYMTEGKRDRALKAEKSGNVNRSPELYQFSLDELILRSDGGALLVAEQFYVYERSYPYYGTYRYWDGTYRYDYFYNYNDLIVVNIRPTGEIEWTARIPKRQETMNDGGYFSSYAMSIVRDRIYFIYNENARNFDQDHNIKRLYNFNGRYSVIALTELNKDGSIRTYPLFHNQDADIITRPKICKQIGSKKMMVYGERGRQFRFATLEFN